MAAENKSIGARYLLSRPAGSRCCFRSRPRQGTRALHSERNLSATRAPGSGTSKAPYSAGLSERDAWKHGVLVVNSAIASFRRLFSTRTPVHVRCYFGRRQPGRCKARDVQSSISEGQIFRCLSPVGPRNLIRVRPSITVYPRKDVAVSPHRSAPIERQSTADGIYGVPGNLVQKRQRQRCALTLDIRSSCP